MALQLEVGHEVPWSRPDRCPTGFETGNVFLGRSPGDGLAEFEVAVAVWRGDSSPTREELSPLHESNTGAAHG